MARMKKYKLNSYGFRNDQVRLWYTKEYVDVNTVFLLAKGTQNCYNWVSPKGQECFSSIPSTCLEEVGLHMHLPEWW